MAGKTWPGKHGRHTYKAAIRMSRSRFWTLLRERHIFTSAHAPMTSNNVHRSVGCIRDVGTMVEKTDNASGDYDETSVRNCMGVVQVHAYMSEGSTRVWVNTVAE